MSVSKDLLNQYSFQCISSRIFKNLQEMLKLLNFITLFVFCHDKYIQITTIPGFGVVLYYIADSL